MWIMTVTGLQVDEFLSFEKQSTYFETLVVKTLFGAFRRKLLMRFLQDDTCIVLKIMILNIYLLTVYI